MRLPSLVLLSSLAGTSLATPPPNLPKGVCAVTPYPSAHPCRVPGVLKNENVRTRFGYSRITTCRNACYYDKGCLSFGFDFNASHSPRCTLYSTDLAGQGFKFDNSSKVVYSNIDCFRFETGEGLVNGDFETGQASPWTTFTGGNFGISNLGNGYNSNYSWQLITDKASNPDPGYGIYYVLEDRYFSLCTQLQYYFTIAVRVSRPLTAPKSGHSQDISFSPSVSDGPDNWGEIFGTFECLTNSTTCTYKNYVTGDLIAVYPLNEWVVLKSDVFTVYGIGAYKFELSGIYNASAALTVNWDDLAFVRVN